MERWMEYLIGGILCLIISMIFFVINKKVSAGMIVSFGFFLYGVYRAIKHKQDDN